MTPSSTSTEQPDNRSEEILISDPLFPWGDGCPYDVLNHRLEAIDLQALGPQSSMRQVLDAFFDLQAGASRGEVNAWHQLKTVGRRLLVDFFHYPTSPVPVQSLDPAALDRPMPIAPLDPARFLDHPFELDDIEDARPSASVHPLPLSELIDLALAKMFPSPLSVNAGPRLADVIEANDDDR